MAGPNWGDKQTDNKGRGKKQVSKDDLKQKKGGTTQGGQGVQGGQNTFQGGQQKHKKT